jgi:hypothetical protein
MSDSGNNLGAAPPRERIENQVVILDYQDFINKHLYKCKLVYRGGQPPNMLFSTFEECEFIFEGPALNTLIMLRGMASPDGGGRELVLKGMLGIDT